MSERPIRRPSDRLPGFRRVAPFVLLIDDDDDRRVDTLQYLVRCGYAVTASGSVSEAYEIMRYVPCGAMAPQVVIMAEQLAQEGGAGLCRELDERFASIHWIFYPHGADILWLAEALGSTTAEVMNGGGA
jgi:CheY-like chemotaxis protein